MIGFMGAWLVDVMVTWLFHALAPTTDAVQQWWSRGE
jgi:hypothetical protein